MVVFSKKRNVLEEIVIVLYVAPNYHGELMILQLMMMFYM